MQHKTLILVSFVLSLMIFAGYASAATQPFFLKFPFGSDDFIMYSRTFLPAITLPSLNVTVLWANETHILNISVININVTDITANTVTADIGNFTELFTVDGSGEINLSNIVNDYVPYTGATKDVDIGAHNLIADQGIFDGPVSISQNGNTNLYINTTSTGSYARIRLRNTESYDMEMIMYGPTYAGTIAGVAKSNLSLISSEAPNYLGAMLIGTENKNDLLLMTDETVRINVSANGPISFDDVINFTAGSIEGVSMTLNESFEALNITARHTIIAGNMTIDGSTLFVDSVNHRLGIGTTAPRAELEVVGGGMIINSDTPYITLEDSTANHDDGRISMVADDMVFRINVGDASWDEMMRMENTGNFGIGTTNPGYTLDVHGDIGFETTGAGAFVEFIRSGTTGGTIDLSAGDFRLTASTNNLVLRTDADEDVILDTRNVGIGTAMPGQKLTVVGTSNTTENATFEKDVTIVGTLFGGSPVKITGINMTDQLTFKEGINGTLVFSIQNTNESDNATSFLTALNDVGYSMNIGIGSSTFRTMNDDYSNFTAMLSRSRGKTVFANFYNQPFIWFTNPSDDNDADNLVEVAKMDSTGFNVSGNFTGNQYYGEMWMHNDTFVTTGIQTQNIWVNVTGFNQTGAGAGQTLNGFSFNAPGEYLQAQVAGKYKVSYSISFGNVGNNQEYQLVIAVNGIHQNSTDTHRKIGSAGDVGNAGSSGFINLAVGDIVTLATRNNDGVGDMQTHAMSMNLVRIAD